MTFWIGKAYAHTETTDLPFAGWHWRPDILIVLIFFCAVYVQGWLRLRRRTRIAVSYGQIGLYLGGLGVLFLALLSPIDALATSRFSMHMVQHLLLVMIAPLLLLLANPLAVFLWGLPPGARQRLGRLLNVRSPLRTWFWALTCMPVTWSFYVINFWGWHHPYLYQMALREGWLHDAEHILFFLSAFLFWWPVVNPAPRLHGSISYGLRIVYLIAATLQNTLLGMVISLPEKVLYPFYEAIPRLMDLSPINDQALGGGIMWVSGHMYLIPILVLVARMLIREEESVRTRLPKEVPNKV